MKYTTFLPVKAHKAYTIGPFRFEFHRNEHSVETYAIRVTDNDGAVCVYTSDTCYRGSLVRFSFGADLLLVDSKLYEGFDGKVEGHMNAEEAGRLASKADVQQAEQVDELPPRDPDGGVLRAARRAATNSLLALLGAEL